MAPELKPRWGEQVLGAGAGAVTAALALAIPLLAGFVAARLVAPSLQSRYFPWITGRALGIASYLSLGALVSLGAWMRHPWRPRRPIVHGASRLSAHAALGIATVALVIGHLSALASDKYAGVGWVGAFVPGKSQYRTLAVGIGVVCFFFMLLLASTARMAGRLGGKHWLLVHRLAAATWAMAWVHGVLSGTDTNTLRYFYLGTGVIVLLLVLSRYAAASDRVPSRVGVAASLPVDTMDLSRYAGGHAHAESRVTTSAP